MGGRPPVSRLRAQRFSGLRGRFPLQLLLGTSLLINYEAKLTPKGRLIPDISPVRRNVGQSWGAVWNEGCKVGAGPGGHGRGTAGAGWGRCERRGLQGCAGLRRRRGRGAGRRRHGTRGREAARALDGAGGAGDEGCRWRRRGRRGRGLQGGCGAGTTRAARLVRGAGRRRRGTARTRDGAGGDGVGGAAGWGRGGMLGCGLLGGCVPMEPTGHYFGCRWRQRVGVRVTVGTIGMRCGVLVGVRRPRHARVRLAWRVREGCPRWERRGCR